KKARDWEISEEFDGLMQAALTFYVDD
ncbi:hypothetical protein HYO98_gp01, partial [Dinoroseobacter phage DS-1410Ws-06]